MGPCLCGDPYCGSCGDPYLAELEGAFISIELFLYQIFPDDQIEALFEDGLDDVTVEYLRYLGGFIEILCKILASTGRVIRFFLKVFLQAVGLDWIHKACLAHYKKHVEPVRDRLSAVLTDLDHIEDRIAVSLGYEDNSIFKQEAVDMPHVYDMITKTIRGDGIYF